MAWGLAWPINKIGLSYMPPIWYTAIRLITGMLTMLVIVIIVKKFSLPERKDWPLIAVVGLLQISTYVLLTNIGLTYLPAGRSSLLAYTTPLWIMPANAFFFHEEIGPLKWLGFITGMLGLIILLSPWELQWANHHIIYGSLILLLAAFSWAISMLCVRHMQWHKSPLELITWQLLAGAIPIVIFAYLKEPITLIHWSRPLFLSLIYTGMLVTGISYWTAVIINRALPTLLISLGFLLVPVLSLAVSAYFMHEMITLSTGMAMSLILLGLLLVIV